MVMKHMVLFMGSVLLCAGLLHAQTWRSVTDEDGYLWARVSIVNDSGAESNWSISGCRTAVASDADAAEIDPVSDWNGVVAAGSSAYVWIYGQALGEISVANADGGDSEFYDTFTLTDGGDGELVIVVSADGTSRVTLETSDAYEVPAVVGGLPQ